MCKTWKVTFIGTVQGVCFRWGVERFFHDRLPEAAGTVQNLQNGDVEVIFEGRESDVVDLEEYCRSKISAASIRQVDIAHVEEVFNLPRPFKII